MCVGKRINNANYEHLLSGAGGIGGILRENAKSSSSNGNNSNNNSNYNGDNSTSGDNFTDSVSSTSNGSNFCTSSSTNGNSSTRNVSSSINTHNTHGTESYNTYNSYTAYNDYTNYTEQCNKYTNLLSEAGIFHAQIGVTLHQNGQVDKCLNHYKNAVKFLSAFSQASAQSVRYVKIDQSAQSTRSTLAIQVAQSVQQVVQVSQAVSTQAVSMAHKVAQLGHHVVQLQEQSERIVLNNDPQPVPRVQQQDQQYEQARHNEHNNRGNKSFHVFHDILTPTSLQSSQQWSQPSQSIQPSRSMQSSLLILVLTNMSTIYHSQNQLDMAYLLLEKASQGLQSSQTGSYELATKASETTTQCVNERACSINATMKDVIAMKSIGIKIQNNMACILAECGREEDAISVLADVFFRLDEDDNTTSATTTTTNNNNNDDDDDDDGHEDEEGEDDRVSNDQIVDHHGQEHSNQDDVKNEEQAVEEDHMEHTERPKKKSKISNIRVTTTANTTSATSIVKVTKEEKAYIYLNSSRIHYRLGLYQDAAELYDRYHALMNPLENLSRGQGRGHAPNSYCLGKEYALRDSNSGDEGATNDDCGRNCSLFPGAAAA